MPEPAPERTPPDDTTTPERKRVPVSVDSPGNDGFRYVEEPATPVTAEGSYDWWRTEVERRDEELERLRAELAKVKAERDAKLRTKALGRSLVEMEGFASRETARAEQAERELTELKTGIAEAVRQIRAWQDPGSAEPLLDHVYVPEVERTLKAYIGEHVIAALEGHTADPEEIRRLAQATTEETTTDG